MSLSFSRWKKKEEKDLSKRTWEEDEEEKQEQEHKQEQE